MDIKLLVSFNTINHHIRNCRTLTPAMQIDIHKFNDFYKFKIIEAYADVVEALVQTIDELHDLTNLKYPLGISESDR
jgi:hypothetical protein